MNMHTVTHRKILEAISADCATHITLTQAEAKRFFKTSEGSYGASDAFLGLTVPTLRKIAKKYRAIELSVIESLLKSKYNEERLLALFILVHQYQTGNTADQEETCQFYLNNLEYVNNWNLVDSSAHLILGHYLWNKDRALLNDLARSELLWKRRIAIVATWYFIRNRDLATTFEIAQLLLQDKHDLIHKAVGWMLREAGKKDEAQLLEFLTQHGKKMPKTMLRYAMEKLAQSNILPL